MGSLLGRSGRYPTRVFRAPHVSRGSLIRLRQQALFRILCCLSIDICRVARSRKSSRRHALRNMFTPCSVASSF
ncbi:hypothetical protein CC86DRAFT_94252 [Ophiobolus disseminans]|uniref:Uncharacterized protein n=1 Tax=Ophiobolus disseminans TaxID=1469910 RepID=A0A6A6ZLJ5_9PLEO|nr:hypothetical protein CC86DRAFT_94252 [Ophiobolus disseminans]